MVPGCEWVTGRPGGDWAAGARIVPGAPPPHPCRRSGMPTARGPLGGSGARELLAPPDVLCTVCCLSTGGFSSGRVSKRCRTSTYKLPLSRVVMGLIRVLCGDVALPPSSLLPLFSPSSGGLFNCFMSFVYFECPLWLGSGSGGDAQCQLRPLPPSLPPSSPAPVPPISPASGLLRQAGLS